MKKTGKTPLTSGRETLNKIVTKEAEKFLEKLTFSGYRVNSGDRAKQIPASAPMAAPHRAKLGPVSSRSEGSRLLL